MVKVCSKVILLALLVSLTSNSVSDNVQSLIKLFSSESQNIWKFIRFLRIPRETAIWFCGQKVSFEQCGICFRKTKVLWAYLRFVSQGLIVKAFAASPVLQSPLPFVLIVQTSLSSGDNPVNTYSFTVESVITCVSVPLVTVTPPDDGGFVQVIFTWVVLVSAFTTEPASISLGTEKKTKLQPGLIELPISCR